MKRGDVWLISFDNSAGGEIQKKRPGIIISNDIANSVLNRVQVIPVTSNTDRLYPSEAYVTINGRKGKALADQITTISKEERCVHFISTLSKQDLEAVEHVIKIQLGLHYIHFPGTKTS